MIVIAYIPLLIAIVGLLLWWLSTRPLVKEAGRILFFCGALVTTAAMANKTFHVGSSPTARR